MHNSLKIFRNHLNNVKVSPYNKVIKRTMYRQACQMAYNYIMVKPPITGALLAAKRDAHQHCAKFPRNSVISQKHSTDDDTGHTHVFTTLCTSNNCYEKTCPRVCEELTQTVINGHLAHTLAPEKKGEELSDIDYSGKAETQHFSKSQERQSWSPEDLKNITEDDYIPVPTATEYVNSSLDILNKTN